MNKLKQEDPVRSPARTVFRIVAVALLGVVILGLTVPNIIVATRGDSPWFVGVTLTPDFLVTSVVSGTPAAQAGLRVGDRLDMGSTVALRQRMFSLGYPWLRPGESGKVPIIRNYERLVISVAATRHGRSAVYVPLIKRITAIIFVIVAGALLLLRPSRMLWGFYLFALGSVNGDTLFFYAFLPGWLQFVVFELTDAIYYNLFYLAGLWIFIARFPGDTANGWRLWIDRAAIPFASLFTGASVASDNLRFVLGNTIPQPMMVGYGFTAMRIGAVALATLCLFSGFIHLRADQRERLKWVVAAIVTYALAAGYMNATDFLPFGGWPRTWTSANFPVTVLNGVEVVIPLAVAYAVLKHRVIDVRFVVSRSVAVGVIAVVIGAVFAAIDWLFTTRLPNSRLEMAAYAGVALLLGFWLNTARQRIGTTIDFLLFRPWFQAQEHMRGLDDAIHHARSHIDLYEPLTTGVAHAFSMASAALFERVEGAGFVRVAAYGWPPGTIWHLLADDPIVLRTVTRSRAVELDAIEWTESGVPAGVARPAIMLPIVAGKQVPALLLYGVHEDGTGLAPDEIRSIRRLCADAGSFYGTLQAPATWGTSLVDQQTQPVGV